MTKQERIAGTETVERQALIAFWKEDGAYQRAENLARGEPFDPVDMRTLDAIQAAARKLAA